MQIFFLAVNRTSKPSEAACLVDDFKRPVLSSLTVIICSNKNLLYIDLIEKKIIV